MSTRGNNSLCSSISVFSSLNCGGAWVGGGQVGAIAFLTRDHFLFNTTFPFEQNNARIMIQLSTDYLGALHTPDIAMTQLFSKVQWILFRISLGFSAIITHEQASSFTRDLSSAFQTLGHCKQCCQIVWDHC